MKSYNFMIASLATILLSSCGITFNTDTPSKDIIPTPTQVSVQTGLTLPRIEDTTTGTVTPIQAPASSDTGIIDSTGIQIDKNTYRSEKYGFQITLPEGLSMYEDSDSSGIAYFICFISSDPNYLPSNTCGKPNSVSMGSLIVTPVSEYLTRQNKCTEDTSEFKDIECSLGLSQDVVGATNNYIITYVSPHEGPEDTDKIFTLLGIPDYRSISTAIQSRISPLVK